MTPLPIPLYFCVRVPEFAAQALLRLRPARRKDAVVVLQGEAPLEEVCAATLQARRMGVRHGMARAEVESFPAVHMLHRSRSEEDGTANVLLEMAARFTPRVEELPRTSAFTLALDMTGSERLFGPPHHIGQKLLRAVRDLGLSARVAASRNLQTAACLVRAPGDTLTVVPPGKEPVYLYDLPLAALGLTDEMVDTFNAWGLRSVGELAALAPEDIVTRLGQDGHRLLRLARGEQLHLLVPAEAAFVLEEHIVFEAPVDNLESLLFVLGPMLDQLIVRARSRALLLASVTVRLHLERGQDTVDRDRRHEPDEQNSLNARASAADNGEDTPTHTRTLKPALPLEHRALLLKLLQLDLQAHPAPAAILAVTLSAEPGPRPGVQSGLFSPQLPEPMRLEVTLARISALVGEGRVGCAVLDDTHRPEAFHVERFTVTEGKDQRRRNRRAPVLPSSPDALRTGVALRRLRPPRPIQVWRKDGKPNAFSFTDSGAGPAHYLVQRAFGPWRRSGHWWSGAAWSHEEWDIDATASDGSKLLCLLTHDLLCSEWQMEALYD